MIDECRELTRRLETLEAGHRALKRRLTGAAIVVGALGLLAISPAPTEYAGSAFVLKDGGGRVRAELKIDRGHPVLAMYDGAQNPRAMVLANDEAGLISLRNPGDRSSLSLIQQGAVSGMVAMDSGGKARLRLGQSSGAPYLSLHDIRGVSRIAVKVDEGGDGILDVYDGNARARAELKVTSGSAGLLLLDSRGTGRALFSTDEENGAHGLMAFDQSGRVRLAAGVGRNGAPRLNLAGADGRDIWNAP